MLSAFKAANEVLVGAVRGIADLITRPGLINVDFADVRTVMSEMGMAMMGSGTARGDDRAQAAAEAAISNPLLDDVNLNGASGILVNITAGPNMTMREFVEIGRVVHDFAADDATVVIGTTLDAEMQDDVRVTVVATGLNRNAARVVPPRTPAREEAIMPQPRPRPVMLRTGTGPAVVATPAPLRASASVPRVRADEVAEAAIAPAAAAPPTGFDYIDIPAFLRKQAD